MQIALLGTAEETRNALFLLVTWSQNLQGAADMWGLGPCGRGQRLERVHPGRFESLPLTEPRSETWASVLRDEMGRRAPS